MCINHSSKSEKHIQHVVINKPSLCQFHPSSICRIESPSFHYPIRWMGWS